MRRFQPIGRSFCNQVFTLHKGELRQDELHFVANYLENGGNARRAILSCPYLCDNPSSAKSLGYQFLKRPSVQKALERWSQDMVPLKGAQRPQLSLRVSQGLLDDLNTLGMTWVRETLERAVKEHLETQGPLVREPRKKKPQGPQFPLARVGRSPLDDLSLVDLEPDDPLDVSDPVWVEALRSRGYLGPEEGPEGMMPGVQTRARKKRSRSVS